MTGELLSHVFGAFAHFECRLLAECTRDGIAAAGKRGRNPGQPAALRGSSGPADPGRPGTPP